MNPYDRNILNEDGSIRCKKVAVIYIEGDSLKLCDGCDNMKPHLASIATISSDVMCICKDCLIDIINEF